MTEVLRTEPFPPDPSAGRDEISDADLVSRVRAGDSAAFEMLFLRHRDVAIRYARRLAGSERAEDLCSEAFAKILDLLQRGKGPDVAFRAYLLTTVRTSHLNNLRAGNREELVPDHEPISRMLPVIEDPDARFDRGAIFRAFDRLPERWQVALWLTAVEGLSHDEAGDHLGIKSNAVASLTFRARAGLRQAYLAEHLLTTTDLACRTIIHQLPGFLRDRVSSRRRLQVEEHLAGCRSCATAAYELSEVDDRLGGLIAPLAFLGLTAGTATVASQMAGTALLAKSAVSTVLGNAKALGAAVPGLLGTKTAIVTGVTVLSVAVGAEVVHQYDGPPSRETPSTRAQTTGAPTPREPLAERSPTPEARLPVLPGDVSPVAPEQVVLAPFDPDDQPPPPSVFPPVSPSVSPSTAAPTPAPTNTPSASASATPSASPSETPTTAPRPMAVGQASTSSYTKDGFRWERVAIPVTDAPKGSTFVLTTSRTYEAAPARTAGTGWVCGIPVLDWADNGPYATATIRCSRSTDRGDGPLEFDFRLAPRAPMTGILTAPFGYTDTTPDDNLVTLVLRD